MIAPAGNPSNLTAIPAPRAFKSQICLARVAGHGGASRRSAGTHADITASEGISRKFLEAILLELRKKGVLASRRGSSGGLSSGAAGRTDFFRRGDPHYRRSARPVAMRQRYDVPTMRLLCRSAALFDTLADATGAGCDSGGSSTTAPWPTRSAGARSAVAPSGLRQRTGRSRAHPPVRDCRTGGLRPCRSRSTASGQLPEQ